MKVERFVTARKIAFILGILLGVAFLAAGLALVFLSMEDPWAKLNLCLFAIAALLGMTTITFGFISSGICEKLSAMDEKLHENDVKEEQGL